MGLPKIGDIVQVEAIHDLTLQIKVEEGMVGQVIENRYVLFVGEVFEDVDEWTAIKWRLGFPPEFSSSVRQKESELV